MELPKRKNIRLKNYDYSTGGAYFITICTHGRALLFGEISVNNANNSVGADSISARIVNDIFLKTIGQYPNVECPKYVIMPDHFHCIIIIERDICKWADMESLHKRADMESLHKRADMESAPTTISEIVQSFKRHTTLEYIKMVKQNLLPPFDKRIWQRSFHDRIIRNEQEYLGIWQYIDTNPLKWTLGEQCE